MILLMSCEPTEVPTPDDYGCRNCSLVSSPQLDIFNDSCRLGLEFEWLRIEGDNDAVCFSINKEGCTYDRDFHNEFTRIGSDLPYEIFRGWYEDSGTTYCMQLWHQSDIENILELGYNFDFRVCCSSIE